MKNQEITKKAEEFLKQNELFIHQNVKNKRGNILSIKDLLTDFVESLQSDVSVSDEEIQNRINEIKPNFWDIQMRKEGYSESQIFGLAQWMRDKLQPKKD